MSKPLLSPSVPPIVDSWDRDRASTTRIGGGLHTTGIGAAPILSHDHTGGTLFHTGWVGGPYYLPPTLRWGYNRGAGQPFSRGAGKGFGFGIH